MCGFKKVHMFFSTYTAMLKGNVAFLCAVHVQPSVFWQSLRLSDLVYFQSLLAPFIHFEVEKKKSIVTWCLRPLQTYPLHVISNKPEHRCLLQKAAFSVQGNDTWQKGLVSLHWLELHFTDLILYSEMQASTLSCRLVLLLSCHTQEKKKKRKNIYLYIGFSFTGYVHKQTCQDSL